MEGKNIAVEKSVGVTAPFTELYDLLGWSVTDPFAEIERIVNELKEVADIIILLVTSQWFSTYCYTVLFSNMKK